MLVDGRVFFNEQIALRHIGLRLVIVVVTDKIFHRIFREKLAELAVQLGRQCFVGRKDNGRAAKPRDHIGHGEGFARTRHPQQRLKHLTVVDAFHKLFDGCRLVPCGQIRLEQLERRIGKLDEVAFGL